MLPAISIAVPTTTGIQVAPRNRCSACSLRDLCVTTGLADSDTLRVEHIIVHRRINRGEVLFNMGDKFNNLYAIRLGHFKTHQLNSDGVEQITGFQMAGELMGMDAISTDKHNCYAVALEDCEVCEIPFGRLQELFTLIPALLRHFHRTMSQEITRDQNTMLLLGNMQAEQRVAAFLVNLSSRYKARGYSATNFQLRMTREDIGKYLGLTLESVSRLFSKFKKMNWIAINNREIAIHDLPVLKDLALKSSAHH